MIGTYASAVLITAVSIVLRRGIPALVRRPGFTWLNPAVGFAALMVICQIPLSLPERGWTAVGAVGFTSPASIPIAAGRWYVPQ